MMGCRSSASIGEGKPTLTLTSSSIQSRKTPKNFTCDDADPSPQLSWSAPPAGTRSFALTVVDRDAMFGPLTHWVIYNIPADLRELPEGLPKDAELIDGSLQGRNDFSRTGYRGPCPPGKSGYRYGFTLYALDSMLDLPPGASREDVEKVLHSHVLALGELVAQGRP